MLHSRMPATFENCNEAAEVGVDVCVRILERVSDTRLGGQVDHAIESFAREESGHGLPVREVEPGEAEAWAIREPR